MPFGITQTGSFQPEIVIPPQYDYSFGLKFGDVVLILLSFWLVLNVILSTKQDKQ